MADRDGGVATVADGTDAEETQGQTSEQSIEQPQTYAPTELKEIFRTVVREENDAFWNDVRRQVTPMQQQLADLAPKIEALLPQIAEVQDDAKATRQLVRDGLAGTLSEEQLLVIDQAKSLQDQRRADARWQREEAQRQKELEEAKRGQLTPEQLRQIRFADAWGIVDDDLDQYTKDQGFRDFKGIADDIKAVVGKEIPAAWISPSDEFGLKRWRREAKAAILAKAAVRDAEGTATVDVPSLRGSGGQSEQEFMDRYGAGELPYTPENGKKARALQAKGILARAKS